MDGDDTLLGLEPTENQDGYERGVEISDKDDIGFLCDQAFLSEPFRKEWSERFYSIAKRLKRMDEVTTCLQAFTECAIAGGRSWNEKDLYEVLHKAWAVLRDKQ